MTASLDYDNFPYDPADVAWGTPLWPEWVKGFRDHQVEAMIDIVEHYRNGVDVVLVNAPTGSGKTIIAEGTRRLLHLEKALYVANTKNLQDQFMRDFGSYAKCLKGRANYPTLDHPELFNSKFGGGISAGDCLKARKMLPACSGCDPNYESEQAELHCANCHPWFRCPYEIAKGQAMTAKLAVTNTSYFIHEANGPGGLSKRQFTIVDECDTLEGILMGFIEVEITARRREQLKIEFPAKKTVADAWMPWLLEEAIPKVGGALMATKGESIEAVREAKYLTGLLGKLRYLERELEHGNAVYDGYNQDKITFKPIRVHNAAPPFLWKHSQKWMLMSATIIDPTEFVESLGIEETGLKWAMVNVPSTFPPANRPIIVRAVANMTNKEKEVEWPKAVDVIRRILAKHPTDRTLIHTVSFVLAKYLKEGLRDVEAGGRPVLIYTDGREKEAVLRKFKATPNAVLLAASMDRGVDLPEDDCRVVIVAKMPFLSLGDKMTEARLYGTRGGQLWYQVQTVRSLVQMTGRGVRSATDTCTTYIIDKQFMSNIWRKSRRLLPDWWTESVDFSGGGI